MELTSYARAVRRSWWIIAITCIVGFTLGGGAAALTPAQYSSSVQFFVSTPNDESGSPFQADQFAQRRVNSYVGLLTSDALATRIIDATRTTQTASEVRSSVSASADLDTVLLTATVTTESAQNSFAYATAIAQEFSEVVADVDNRGSPDSPSVVLNVISEPDEPTSPVSPNTLLYLALGLAAGGLVGLGIAVAREVLLDRRVRSSEGLRLLSSASVLGVVPRDRDARSSPVAITARAGALRGEAFRQVRTNLRFLDATHPVQVVTVTSSVAGEGKTTTALNLALAFATTGQRTLLIEADLRRPQLANYLELQGAVGLSNILAGQAGLADVTQAWGTSGMDVVVAGTLPPNPAELIDTPPMAALIAKARDTYDAVVVDTPPVVPVTDAAVVSGYTDGVLVVVRHAHATKVQVASAYRTLRGVDARVLGSVLTMVPQSGADGQEGYAAYHSLTDPGLVSGLTNVGSGAVTQPLSTSSGMAPEQQRPISRSGLRRLISAKAPSQHTESDRR